MTINISFLRSESLAFPFYAGNVKALKIYNGKFETFNDKFNLTMFVFLVMALQH